MLTSTVVGRLRERGRDVLEPAGRVSPNGHFLLRAPTLHLLERESCLIGKTTEDDEGRRIGLRDDDLPGHGEDELAPTRDDNRSPQRRADAETPNEIQPRAVRRLEHVGNEGGRKALDRLTEARKVVERKK